MLSCECGISTGTEVRGQPVGWSSPSPLGQGFVLFTTEHARQTSLWASRTLVAQHPISLLEWTISGFSFLGPDLRWSCMYGKRYWAPQLWKPYILTVYYFKDIIPKKVFLKVSGIIFMTKIEKERKKSLLNCSNTAEKNKLWRFISATVPHWRDSHVYTTATPPAIWPGSTFTDYFPLSRWLKKNKSGRS